MRKVFALVFALLMTAVTIGCETKSTKVGSGAGGNTTTHETKTGS